MQAVGYDPKRGNPVSETKARHTTPAARRAAIRKAQAEAAQIIATAKARARDSVRAELKAELQQEVRDEIAAELRPAVAIIKRKAEEEGRRRLDPEIKAIQEARADLDRREMLVIGLARAVWALVKRVGAVLGVET